MRGEHFVRQPTFGTPTSPGLGAPGRDLDGPGLDAPDPGRDRDGPGLGGGAQGPRTGTVCGGCERRASPFVVAGLLGAEVNLTELFAALERKFKTVVRGWLRGLDPQQVFVACTLAKCSYHGERPLAAARSC